MILKETHKYDDIIHLSRPESPKRARMSMLDRGAQFSPFAALTGHDEMICETARLTDFQTDLDEGEKLLLNEKLQRISQILEENPSIQIVIDLHRDGVGKNVHLVKEIDGKQCLPILWWNFHRI